MQGRKSGSTGLNRRDAIVRHYQAIWGVPAELCTLDKGRLKGLPPDFSVFRFPPHGERTFWAYATYGMAVPGDEYLLELHMFSPYASEKIEVILMTTADYHRLESALRCNHIVNFGVPWLEDSLCERGLLSWPYVNGSDIEPLRHEGKDIHCLWLLPITDSEKEYAIKNGVNALENKFDQNAIEFSWPGRPSVV
jgi:hypothetical protein